MNAPSTWNSEIVKFLRTKLAQGAEIGLVWMPQALTRQNEIQKFQKIWEKNWLKGLKIVQFECPKHLHAQMKFRIWRKFENKIGSRGCKWSGLNAPETKMPEWNSQVEQKLSVNMAQGAANGPAWMPQGLEWVDEILKLNKIWEQNWLKGL